MYDYQGMCEIWVRGVSGANSLFIDVSIPCLLSTISADLASHLLDQYLAQSIRRVVFFLPGQLIAFSYVTLKFSQLALFGLSLCPVHSD